jgi:3-oxoacyl-[acyl-carrier protein] reductase
VTPGDGRPLAGRVAVVTGAAGGIGRATALRLAADGAVVGALDRDVAGLDAALGGSTDADDRPLIVPLLADVIDESAVRAALATLTERHGAVGILVNNAGIGGHGGFLDATQGDWDRMLAVHLGGALACTRAVLPGMLAAREGRIVNILTDGLWHGRTSTTYTAAKGALLGLTRSLALEVAAQGVRVNAVAPGPVDTPMFLDAAPEAVAAERATVPIGRSLQPDEVAATIAFLCGPGGDAYVGQVLGPNGGTVAGV